VSLRATPGGYSDRSGTPRKARFLVPRECIVRTIIIIAIVVVVVLALMSFLRGRR
jgi:hypothetical protein